MSTSDGHERQLDRWSLWGTTRNLGVSQIAWIGVRLFWGRQTYCLGRNLQNMTTNLTSDSGPYSQDFETSDPALGKLNKCSSRLIPGYPSLFCW